MWTRHMRIFPSPTEPDEYIIFCGKLHDCTPKQGGLVTSIRLGLIDISCSTIPTSSCRPPSEYLPLLLQRFVTCPRPHD